MSIVAVAPGKVLLSGAYVVLGGAPAVVCAVDRCARASATGSGFRTAEVEEAGVRCTVDVSALEQDGKKLGLGSSAAALVAALALEGDARGDVLDDPSVRQRLYARAKEIHARVQGGGSGVDVAASTFGGVSIFKDGVVRPVELPEGVTLAVFFSGTSARTSALLERVRALAARDPALYVERMSALTAAAVAAADAIERSDGPRFVSSVAAHLGGLAALGEAADAPIVLPAFRELGTRAQADGAAFIPSGAGGGDVGVFVGMGDPSPSFLREAERLSLRPIPLRIDTQGVRIERP